MMSPFLVANATAAGVVVVVVVLMVVENVQAMPTCVKNQNVRKQTTQLKFVIDITRRNVLSL